MTTRSPDDLATPRLGGRRRTIAFVVAVLQLAVAFFAPVLDARAEGRGAWATAHVESGTGISCVTLHDHEHCLTCRVIGTGIGAAPNASLPAISRQEPPHAAPIEGAAAWVVRTLHPPRPPPATSA